MKRTLIIGVIAALLGVVLGGNQMPAWAINFLYTQNTVSVNSSSVPVVVLTPAFRRSYAIKPRSTAAAPILCWTYLGTTPVSVPSACTSPSTTPAAGCVEIAAGQPLNDAVTADNPSSESAIGEGWACVLSTGSTPVTTDSSWR